MKKTELTNIPIGERECTFDNNHLGVVMGSSACLKCPNMVAFKEGPNKVTDYIVCKKQQFNSKD